MSTTAWVAFRMDIPPTSFHYRMFRLQLQSIENTHAMQARKCMLMFLRSVKALSYIVLILVLLYFVLTDCGTGSQNGGPTMDFRYEGSSARGPVPRRAVFSNRSCICDPPCVPVSPCRCLRDPAIPVHSRQRADFQARPFRAIFGDLSLLGPCRRRSTAFLPHSWQLFAIFLRPSTSRAACSLLLASVNSSHNCRPFTFFNLKPMYQYCSFPTCISVLSVAHGTLIQIGWMAYWPAGVADDLNHDPI